MLPGEPTGNFFVKAAESRGIFPLCPAKCQQLAFSSECGAERPTVRWRVIGLAR
jgi:hypothetical protein